jgi:SAM-dependent methyltransferase
MTTTLMGLKGRSCGKVEKMNRKSQLMNFKQNGAIKSSYRIFMSVRNYFKFQPIKFIKRFSWFLHELNTFKRLGKNQAFQKMEIYPCLSDNIGYTPIEPVYFFQDTWAARKIAENKPHHHYDIGSSAKTMGILSQFVPITMVDIRPLEIELPNLSFIKGTLLDLPFEDDSIESLSSLCVVEHIGLGRYGDPLDPFGSEKAIKEMKRVLKPGGKLLFSVPVDSENKICFNAHRTFTRDYILTLFSDMVLLEEKYIYRYKMYNHYDSRKGFGTGLYLFKKGD